MKCGNIKCMKEFIGRPNKIFCSDACMRSNYKSRLRFKKLLIGNDYDKALSILNMGRMKVSIDEWKEKCNKKYRNYYDYSKVFFNKLDNIVTIICPKHGEFTKNASYHLNKSGCVYCDKKSNIIHISDVKERLKNNQYFDFVDFDIYINGRQKIEVLCKKSGHKSYIAARHLFSNNVNCAYCSKVKMYSTEEWIENSIKIHGNKYNYSESEYKGTKNNIKIICPNHGAFYQRPHLHIKGAGCRICNRSIGESIIYEILNSINIEFESQKSFDNLKYINKLYFDFYLPEYNLCLEFDGVQHYKSFEFFGGDVKLKDTIIKDQIKNQFCNNNGIKLLRISYSINYKNRDKIKDKIHKKIINKLNDI